MQIHFQLVALKVCLFFILFLSFVELSLITRLSCTYIAHENNNINFPLSLGLAFIKTSNSSFGKMITTNMIQEKTWLFIFSCFFFSKWLSRYWDCCRCRWIEWWFVRCDAYNGWYYRWILSNCFQGYYWQSKFLMDLWNLAIICLLLP